MKLEETIIILPKSKIKAGDGKKEGKYLLYRSSNKIDTYYDEYIIDTEAIIVGTGGNPSIHYNIGKCAYTTQCLAITSKGTLKNKYIYYYLLSQLNRIQNMFRGMTIKQLDKKEFLKMDIPIIEVDIQDKIIENLDIITNNIQSKKEQVKKLEQLVKSQFVEMFELEKYELEMLGGVSNFIDYRGKTPTISDDKEVRIVNAKSVGKGFFKYIDEYITEDLYEKWMKRGIAYAGDVLFVTEGHTFGNTCLIPDGIERFALGQRVITIQGKEKLNNIYLCYYMQLDEFINKINIYKTGGTAKGIRSKDLAKITIPIPPIDLQNQFSEIVKQIDKQKFEIEKSLKKIQELYESLMKEYFKGERR